MHTLSQEQGTEMKRSVRTERFVMKCGGSTLAALPDTFYQQLAQLQAKGMMPVIVHGGGPAISAMLDKLGIESEFVGGLRKTDEAVLDVVEMVLAGQINKQIVRRLTGTGARAVGLSGTDGGLIQARPVSNRAEVGYVGDVTRVNAELVEALISRQYMPVIAPLGLDGGGQRYNINADTAAGAIAAHLGVERLIVITDVPGIMKMKRRRPHRSPRRDDRGDRGDDRERGDLRRDDSEGARRDAVHGGRREGSRHRGRSGARNIAPPDERRDDRHANRAGRG